MKSGSAITDPSVSAAVFHPRPDFGGVSSSKAEDLFIEVETGVKLRVRLYEAARRDAPFILFFHGNGETATDYDDMAEAFRALPATLAIAEYRGYGPSTGVPRLETLLPDARKVFDALRKTRADRGFSGPVVAMGRSLGSAPAIELASSRSDEVAALAVDSGFARIVPLLELLRVPARRLGITENDGPRNLEKMGRISLPTLVIHGEVDEIISVEDAVLLTSACRDPQKVFLRVPRAGHNDIHLRAGRSYFDALAALLARLKK